MASQPRARTSPISSSANLAGVLGAAFGVALALAGLAVLAWTERSDP